MKHRVFVTPYSAEGEMSLDDLSVLAAAQLDANNEPDDDTPDDEPETPAGDAQQPEVTAEDAEGKAPEVKQKRTVEDKQQYAFAQQRHEISELTELLQTMADATGIKYTDKKDLVAKLKDQALVERATKQNIPVELLREVEQLRADSAQWKQYQHEQNAMAGFNRVATEFGLDQKGLEDFAVELDQAGRNPFTQAVDVVAEYKARHLDDIVNRKVQAAVEAALKGDVAASLQSSTPSTQQGAGSDKSTEKITTMAQLNALLRR